MVFLLGAFFSKLMTAQSLFFVTAVADKRTGSQMLAVMSFLSVKSVCLQRRAERSVEDIHTTVEGN